MLRHTHRMAVCCEISPTHEIVWDQYAGTCKIIKLLLMIQKNQVWSLRGGETSVLQIGRVQDLISIDNLFLKT